MTKVPIQLAPFKERDLHAQIRENGFERGVAYTLGRVIGEHAEDRQHVRELTQLVDQCITLVNNLVMVNTKLRDTVRTLQRVQAQSEALDGQ
jgi:hypothetical protein